ncbi:MAG: LysR family transcriptional regulator substrate-binding protein, partial [Cyanobacteria bacterium REEB65]|nr:LysR family transcriptional regulator substrate-binding protein [Cyanobacteria bacterium REEB65]
EMLPDDVETWVAAGDVAVGLLLRKPRRPDLDCFEGLKTPYVIAGKPGPVRPWQDFGYIVPRFFHRELPESLDGWPEQTFKRRIAAEVELLETAISLAEAGVGAAFVPELAVKERVASGALAVVAEAPCAFFDQLFVVWRKGLRPTPASRQLFEALRGTTRLSTNSC